MDFAVCQFLELVDVGFRLDDGVKSQIDQIRTELQKVEALVKDVRPGQSDDDVIRQLARDIRDLGYKFEDFLEIFAPHDPKPFNCIQMVFHRERQLRVLKPIVNNARRIRYTFQEITQRARLSELEQDLIRSRNNAAYESHEFVRRDEMMELLKSCLIESSGQAVSITGVGGVGKTAIAKEIFNHEMTRYTYENRIWVHVSETFQRKKILESILEQLRVTYDATMQGEEELLRRIFDCIERRKILIVFDDIWSFDHWESLRVVGRKCTVLFTTRMKDIAETVRTSAAGTCIQLTRLTDDEGCQLLARNVPEFLVKRIREDLGKKIVDFCAGLPLTIVIFLRSMATKNTLEEWEEAVNQRLNCSFSKRIESREIGETLQVLASTYNNLPHVLKTFFLYMGVLQEDLQVDVERLYLLWLADRVIPLKKRHEGERLLVDVAQGYVNELAQRNMVDVVEENELPTITRFKFFRLNGLMRDLALSKNRDEGFFKVVEFTRGRPDSFSSSSSSSYRVAINLDEYEEGCDFPVEDRETTRISVLLFVAKKKQVVWPKGWSSLVKFVRLRVLDFNGFNFESSMLPVGIGSAVRLRYLSFRDCVLPNLPSSVANLKLLYILDLRVQQSTKTTIPNVLWKLKRLRHLYFPQSFETQDGGKLRLDGLIELETITNFNAWLLKVEDLFNLPKLEYLDSHVVGNLDDIEGIIKRVSTNESDRSDSPPRASVEIKNFDCYAEERHSAFRRLLSCKSLEVLCMEGHIGRMPLHRKISHNLVKIVFTGSELLEDPMTTLGKLAKLRVLVLDDAFAGKEMVCSAESFLELKMIQLLNMQDLEKWDVEDGAMLKLSSLTIVNCVGLEMLPEGLKFVRGLRELKVLRMPKEFENRIRKVEPERGLDVHKVEHVTSVVFDD